MAGLDETVGLDISDALASVDQLASSAEASLTAALTSAAEAFAAALTDATAGLETTASVDVAVTADTSEAQTEVQGFVATVDSENAAISVDADTTEAQSAVDDLTSSIDAAGESASTSSGHVSSLSLSTGQLAGVAGLAVGEVGGLREASSLLGERTAVATTGALGLAAGIGELYHQGIQAVSAEERFNQVLGETAAAVEQVNVGNLNTGLFELTHEMGATDAATRNAAATIFQFSLNAGTSREGAARFTDELFALASRAVALKPSLGDVTDVATSMEVGLGRARSAAQQFGISISQAEINTRALSDTGKASASELTAYEKSVAGAEIALDRYGTTLKGTIADGSENAEIEQRRLKATFEDFLASAGKPLVAPALDLIKEAIPVGKDLATALSDVASVAIPLLTTALDVLGPAIEPALVGFVAFKAANAAISFASWLAQAPAAAAGFLGIGAAATTAGEETLVAGEEMAAGEAAATGGLSLIIGVAAAAIVGLGGFAGAEESAADASRKFADDLTHTADAALAAKFNRSVDDTTSKMNALGLGVTRSGIELRTFRAVADENVGTAQRLIDSLDAQGVNTAKLTPILDDAVAAQKRKTEAENDSKTTSDQLLANTQAQNTLNAAAYTSLSDYAAGTGTATQAIKDLTAAQTENNDALSLYKTELEGIQGLQGDVTAAQAGMTESNSRLFDSLVKNGVQFDVNTDAGAANIRSLLGARDSATSLAEATFKSEVATRGETQARADADAVLAGFKQRLDDTLYGLGLNTAQVDALNQQLGLVVSPPPVVITIDFTTNTPDVLAEINRALSATPGVGSVYAGFTFPTRASGGPVEPGVPYLVNEDTPRSEVFVPREAGTIYPAGTGPNGTSAGGWAGGPQTVDRSITNNVTTSPTQSETEVARKVTQRQVAMQYLIGT